MQIKVPDDHLVVLCGGTWGDNTSTDIGAIVKKFLYENPSQENERRVALGLMLVNVLELKLKE